MKYFLNFGLDEGFESVLHLATPFSQTLKLSYLAYQPCFPCFSEYPVLQFVIRYFLNMACSALICLQGHVSEHERARILDLCHCSPSGLAHSIYD
jgi:hypothetical protein